MSSIWARKKAGLVPPSPFVFRFRAESNHRKIGKIESINFRKFSPEKVSPKKVKIVFFGQNRTKNENLFISNFELDLPPGNRRLIHFGSKIFLIFFYFKKSLKYFSKYFFIFLNFVFILTFKFVFHFYVRVVEWSYIGISRAIEEEKSHVPCKNSIPT